MKLLSYLLRNPVSMIGVLILIGFVLIAFSHPGWPRRRSFRCRSMTRRVPAFLRPATALA